MHQIIKHIQISTPRVCMVVQISSWAGLKEFMNSFSQKGCEALPRSWIATSLAPHSLETAQAWICNAAMMQTALGLPRKGELACTELDSFVDRCGIWVSL